MEEEVGFNEDIPPGFTPLSYEESFLELFPESLPDHDPLSRSQTSSGGASVKHPTLSDSVISSAKLRKRKKCKSGNDIQHDAEISKDSVARADVRAVRSCSHTVRQPALMPSLFSETPPTINFVEDGASVELLPWCIRRLLKWKMSSLTPNVVKNTIARSHFRVTKKGCDWLGYWGSHMKSHSFRSIRECQKINHFPGSFQLGRKDRLWRNLLKLQVHFGKKDFSFFPQTFCLPCDLKLLKLAWDDCDSKQKWILKPPASARGIGVKVIKDWNSIPKRKSVLVQKYISRPFLINESKFDMRLYVYVTCYDPLRIYLFDDGLARFASVKYSYSSRNISNRYIHLTNYSINKKNNDYESNTNPDAQQGHKWTLKTLWAYMENQGIQTDAIKADLKDVIIKTIISSESWVFSLTKANVRRRYCCHELFGFDIMLDEHLKPWILEVNVSPSLHSNSTLDKVVKGRMVKDLLNTAGFTLPNAQENKENVSAEGWTVPKELLMDRRLGTSTISNDERGKHAFYCQRRQDESLFGTILDVLTPDDIRILCETFDEDSRKGGFERIFPVYDPGQKYLRYFEVPRYYNLLLHAWLLKYRGAEGRGIALLETFCEKGVHLETTATSPQHTWSQSTVAHRTYSAKSNQN